MLARSGSSLDQAILSPITGGASNINIYGAVDGANVYRPNAITGDPNHLGVMLIIPLLALTALYLRLERGHRWKAPLAVTLAFLLIVELTTLSRSGLLGLIVGLAVLALPYRRFFLTKAFLAPLAAVVGLLSIVVLSRLDYFQTIFRSRVRTGGGASRRTSASTTSSRTSSPRSRSSGSGSTTSRSTTSRSRARRTGGRTPSTSRSSWRRGSSARRSSASSSGTSSRASAPPAAWGARSPPG